MKSAKVLAFPYSRIRQEPEAHTAKVLHMPAKAPSSPVEFWVAFTCAWVDAFNFDGIGPK